MKNETNDIKDLSVRVFKTTFTMDGKTWLFEVRKHHSPDPRFEGILNLDAENSVEFVMVRTSIGKWLITGDGLPSEIEEHAQEIGNAFEQEDFRLKNHHSSKSYPGVKEFVSLQGQN